MRRTNGFAYAMAAGVMAALGLLVLTADAKGPATGPATDKGAPVVVREPVARLKARLSGYEEVPAVSTTGAGTFQASVQDGMIRYLLRYADTTGELTQSHIHVGQAGVNGGVALFLCSNLDNAPMGVQACPPAPAEITGLITAADVVGPAGQGVQPGDLDAVLRAIKAGVAYVNVHTDRFPSGEIRGQLRMHDRGRASDGRGDKGSPSDAFLDASAGALD